MSDVDNTELDNLAKSETHDKFSLPKSTKEDESEEEVVVEMKRIMKNDRIRNHDLIIEDDPMEIEKMELIRAKEPLADYRVGIDIILMNQQIQNDLCEEDKETESPKEKVKISSSSTSS